MQSISNPAYLKERRQCVDDAVFIDFNAIHLDEALRNDPKLFADNMTFGDGLFRAYGLLKKCILPSCKRTERNIVKNSVKMYKGKQYLSGYLMHFKTVNEDHTQV